MDDYRELGKTGLLVSALSYGASPLGGVFREVDEAEGIRTVHTALDLGINFIDVSPYYGLTRAEAVLGKALRGIARDRYYVATKVGRYGEDRFDFSAQRVTRSVDESLARLGIEYVDLIQCHDIEFADHDVVVNETLPTLLELKKQGYVRHIGITGLPLKIFPSILDRVEPGVVETILSFCHYELNDTSLGDLIPYLQGKGVGIINASPTGMGLLTQRGAPSWHPSTPAIQEGCRKAMEHCRAKGVDIVRLAIQFACDDERIASTLVGSANPENIKANIEHLEAPRDPELLAEVMEILEPIHNFNWTRGLPQHRDVILG